MEFVYILIIVAVIVFFRIRERRYKLKYSYRLYKASEAGVTLYYYFLKYMDDKNEKSFLPLLRTCNALTGYNFTIVEDGYICKIYDAAKDTVMYEVVIKAH